MARFFKPLLSAVALAATALTSTATLAAYAYNAQISVVVPKGTNAETAAKDKTLPAGVKYTTCVGPKSGVTNWDQFALSVKFDAGKTSSELADVYVVLQNLTNKGLATIDAGSRYIFVERLADADIASTGGVAQPTAEDGDVVATAGVKLATATLAIKPYLSAAQNLGTGAQTEILFGGNLAMEGLPQGLWTATVIIAKPGTTLQTFTAAAPANPTAYEGAFSFARPETWAAHDTVAFVLGTPLDNTPTTGVSTACL